MKLLYLYSLKLLALTIVLLLNAAFVKGATITSTATGGVWGASATWVGGLVPEDYDVVVIATSGSNSVQGNKNGTTYTCAGLTINSGAMLTMYCPIIVNGTTTITGTINFGATNSNDRLMTFNGAVTLNNGAVWNETTTGAIPTFAFTGSFTNNSTTFTTQNGTHAFSGAAMTIRGTTVTSIPQVTMTGTYINNGTLTIASSLAGAGGLINNATSVLNLGGTATITTLTATAVGNTINYTGASQTVKATTYDRLILLGSGTKTITSVTVNGILSMEGTATASAAPTYGAAAILQYNSATGRTAGVEWVTPFAASGGVIIANTGIITMNATKVFNASVPLVINSGATLVTNNLQLIFGGNFVNNGTFTAGSAAFVIANTAATQSISGFTTTGLVSMTKTAGTATFSGNVNGAGLAINGIGGTLNLGSGLTHTFSGTWTSTSGTLNGGSSTLRLGSGYSGTSGTFTASSGTVEYYASGIQTIFPLTYNNLTLSGTSAKTFSTGATSVNGVFSLEGTATTTLTGTLTYGANATLQYKGSTTQITGAEFPATWSGTGGVKIENPNGVKLNAAKSMGSAPFAIGSAVVNSLFNDGGFQLTATGTLNLTSGTFKLGAAGATTFPGFGTNNIAAGTTVEYAATAAQTVKGLQYSNLSISGTGTNPKTANANTTVNGILTLSSDNASATKGCLEMDVYTLTMGATATTAGTGDVTGIVNRNSFAINIPYTFGNKFTTMYIAAGSKLPSSVSFKIVLTILHSWKSNAIHRYYDIIQTGGDNTTSVNLNLHYLDSELNATTKGNLDIFDDIVATSVVDDHGQSNFNTTDNWVSLASLNLTYVAPSSSFGVKYWTLGTAGIINFTWSGASTDWNSKSNWVGGGVPSSNDQVVIPDASTTSFSPVLPAIPNTIGSIIIQSGGILNGGTGTKLIISGATGAWVNRGTFNAGTSTIIFANAGATMATTTNFYNVTVNSGATLTLGTDNIMRIAGVISLSSSGILNAANNYNTVEYNGTADQTIINPNGIPPGYYNLILSGNGTKTLPVTAFSIGGNLSLSGTAMVTVAGVTNVDGNLTIANGSRLTVSPTINLTVLSTLINNSGASGLVLKSDATGTASIVHNMNNVPATVERFISGNAKEWHFLSSPVAAQSISGSWMPPGTYGNGTGYDLYLWNESSSFWIYKMDSTSTITWKALHPGVNFMVGHGYLYSVQAVNPTKVFKGMLNNGPINIGLTLSSIDPILKGFNLVGNPYPSPIDWGATTGWGRSNLTTTGGGFDMWIWNPASKNYGVYNSSDASGIGTNSVTRYIAAMQGYFVRASNTGNLSMNNDVRVLDVTGSVFKSKKQVDNKISLSVNSDAGYGSDEIQLRFGFFENGNGAMKLFSKTLTAPSLYMDSRGNSLSVQYLTSTRENPEVPLMFSPGVNGNYTFNCNFDQSNFDTIMLEDRQTHYIQNLKVDKIYGFIASKTDDANRFTLHFKSIKTFSNKELPGRIYLDDVKVVVDLTLISKETDVFIYDIMGRILYQQKLQGRIQHKISINAHTQMIIVSIKNPDGSYCRKLTWVGK